MNKKESVLCFILLLNMAYFENKSLKKQNVNVTLS